MLPTLLKQFRQRNQTATADTVAEVMYYAYIDNGMLLKLCSIYMHTLQRHVVVDMCYAYTANVMLLKLCGMHTLPMSCCRSYVVCIHCQCYVAKVMWHACMHALSLACC